MRICSLLPGATDIVVALGLADRLVAVTHECELPPGAPAVPVITRSPVDPAWSSGQIHRHLTTAAHAGSSLYALDAGRLAELDPDLVLTQELCDVCAPSYVEVAAAVRRLDLRRPAPRTVLSLAPTSLSGVLQAVEQVAVAAGAADRGRDLVGELRDRIARVAATASRVAHRPRVFAMEWLEPVFGAGHWVPEMVRLAGGQAVLGREGARSAEVSWAELVACDPEIVVVMPCSFSLPRTLQELGPLGRRRDWSGLGAVRAGRVYAVDAARYFSRSGPRVVEGLEIVAEIVHPELFPRRSPPDAWARVGGAGAGGEVGARDVA